MSVDVGDPAPDFVVEDQYGEALRLSEILRDEAVVLYFYPKDETPGCTVEARGFRDLYEGFTEAGAKVIGVSHDSRTSHARFTERHGLPFALVSDPDGELRARFGVPKTLGVVPGRTTYVIDRSGIVRMKFNSMVRPGAHVRKALEIVRGLH